LINQQRMLLLATAGRCTQANSCALRTAAAALGCLLQVLLHALLLRHRPELNRQLLQHAKLPGESQEAANARWRQVAVSAGRHLCGAVPLSQT
jgi:hypothetical protein